MCDQPTPPPPSMLETRGLGLLPVLAEELLDLAVAWGCLDGLGMAHQLGLGGSVVLNNDNKTLRSCYLLMVCMFTFVVNAY